jgi:ribonuclease BN (tRNA processing enzyme)
MTNKASRRRFLAQSAFALAGVFAAAQRRGPAQPRGRGAEWMRLVLLGTAGGPTPKLTRAAPAQVILHHGAAYVVDCGNGVARQLRLAGVSLQSIRHVFITHHHSDHNADYGNLLLLAWASDLTTPVDSWGPPPLAKMTRLFLDMNETDIKVRMADEGRPALAPLVRPHEISQAGVVLRDGDLTVTCARVHHPLVESAFAYRFDSPARSIVISGDTSPSASLVTLARNADVLVHEVLYLPAVEKIIAGSPNPAALRKHLLDSHTPLDQVGRIAAEVNVKTLVLSHFTPGETTEVADEVWRQGAQAHFKGEVIVGRDLMEI